MSNSSLHYLTQKDLPRAVACLKDAFKDDPLWAEVFKNDPHRDEALSAFFTYPLLYGMKFGKVCASSPELEGVAVWLPGRYATMTIWRLLRCGALFYGRWMGKETIHNLIIISKHLVPERKRLMYKKPHIYLAIIGVISMAQGKGIGSKLIEAISEECDRKNLHLYLETEKEENLSFYQKHGFFVIQKIMLGRINLPMWLMERKPQKAFLPSQ